MIRKGILPLHEYLLRAADRSPEKEFLVQGERRVDYGSLRSDAECIAGHLQGISPGFEGERVCLFLDNSPEYIAAYFGILRAGGVAVPLGDRIASRGAWRILDDCRPAAVVVKDSIYESLSGVLAELPYVRSILIAGTDGTGRAPKIPSSSCEGAAGDPRTRRLQDILKAGKGCASAIPRVTTDRLAMIIYTSGTTGSPKGVMLSHRNLASNAVSIIEYLGLTPDDKMMVVLPFYYSYGTSLLTTHVIAGGSLVLENSLLYPNIVLEKMEAERVTGFAGVPSTFSILLRNSAIRRHTFPHLRYLTQAGGAMSQRQAMELLDALPGKRLFIMYGQTEASARLSYLPPEDVGRKPGSIGKAIPGVKLTIRKRGGRIASPGEAGEIVADGPNVMAGYWNLPKETRKVLKEDGLHTGDIAKADEEGYLYIVGRKADFIKSGAHRIGAREIEEVLLEIPDVIEAAVVGEPDEVLGESVKACVVLRRGAEVGKNDVLVYCRKNLPAYKVPKHVVFLPGLPKTASGKVKKHCLAGAGKRV